MRTAVTALFVTIFLVPFALGAHRTRSTPAELETLLRRGDYEKVLARVRPLRAVGRLRLTPSELRAQLAAARAERALGRTSTARARLEIATVAAPADLELRAELLRVAQEIGDAEQARILVDLFIDEWPADREATAPLPDLLAMAEAYRACNAFSQASALLRTAVKRAERDPAPHIAWGDLLLEKHALDDAERAFHDALLLDARHPDALVGLARSVLEQRYDREAATALLDRALAENPRHERALTLHGALALDAEDWARARTFAARLRATNPRAPGALWLEAALARLFGDDAAYIRLRDEALAQRPGPGDFFAEITEALVRQRRYSDARAVAEDCVRVAPAHAGCLASLGTTLLRLGEETAGLALLRQAFDVDPFDARTLNQLELFEKTITRDYITMARGPFRFRIEPASRLVIERVVAPFLERIYAHYTARYGFAPPGPITIELYGRPSDFAIRTVGLPYLDVEAVCFGTVITAHAPTSASASWGMVLAHELAHTFALAIGRERVPRWFTEGLAELETARIHESWTRRDHLLVWGAWKRGELPRLGRISSAFINARTPEQAVTAYMYSALALNFLESRHGFARVLNALSDFGAGLEPAQVLVRLAGEPLEALEAAFDRWLSERYAHLESQLLPTVTDLLPRAEAERQAARRGADAAALARAGLAAAADRDLRAARRWLRLSQSRAETGGERTPLVTFLDAVVADREHDPARAQKALSALLAAGYEGYDLRTRLGIAAVETGDLKVAELHFRRATELIPEDIEAWAYLASLYEKQGRAHERLSAQIQAFSLDPQNLRLGRDIVYTAARLQAFAETASIAPLVLFIDPGDPDVHATLARALRALGRVPEAIAAFENAVALSPTPARALHQALAELYIHTGDLEAARRHDERARGLGGGDRP